MTDDGDATVFGEMGYSLDEFDRVLPLAMRDWAVRGGRPDWSVEQTDGTCLARIHVDPQPERRIGALSLPVLAVTIDHGGTPRGLVDELLRRFERGFHRGGG